MFKKATRQLAKAKIALTGPSGSGKTFSALRLAHGFGGRWAVLDTENNSAGLYCDRFSGWEYEIAAISPPYTAKKYFDAIDYAISQKYDGLIIDSASHLWAGEGGLLQQKEALDSRGGNSYTNWGQITKLHEQFKSYIQNAPLNMIVTMRSKQEYVMEQNEKGKSAPKKVGLAPIQRDGLEYEFTVVFDIGMDHQFVVSKDRTGLFDGTITTITESTGQTIKDWLGDGGQEKQVAAAGVESQPTTEPLKPMPTSSSSPAAAESVPEVSTNPKNHAPTNDDVVLKYVIDFGKFTGKKLTDLGLKAALDYRDFITSSAQKAGKQPHGPAGKFCDMVKIYEASNQASQLS